MKSPYNSEFYHSYIGESEASAATVVPKIVELFKPCSVIDIGCGVGTWLKVFKEHGVQRLRGLDGSYVKEVDYRIDWSCFREANLENPSRPENESFDLIIILYKKFVATDALLNKNFVVPVFSFKLKEDKMNFTSFIV